MFPRLLFLVTAFQLALPPLYSQEAAEETFAALTDERAPANFREMWSGFDPRQEPLEVETLDEWEVDGVVLRVVRFRIGVFRGQPAKLAAIYGFPKGQRNLPGLLQIHGGGQYADEKACIANAKRGYATLSIAWAGRISSSKYPVSPSVVQLFWDKKMDDPLYRLTTDWGAVDGYHAPSRNQGNQFPSAKAAAWTIDAVESPRNSGWFLCAVAARRALTFLERQPEVDKARLGVYGHSMGGKLTVLAAVDDRVKAAAPSCGGISDRYNESELFRETLGDDVSLAEITSPIIFLSPANDFHGRIGDLSKAVGEIQSPQWRVTCSPHHGHQDTASFEVATLLWFDEHLKRTFKTPATPTATMALNTTDGVPTLTVIADDSMPMRSVDVYYTQHGKPEESSADRELSTHRFWRHVKASPVDGKWMAAMPVLSIDKPIWAYANVTYELDEPVSGAGYYYRVYTANAFNLSSQLSTATPQQLQKAGVKPTLQPSLAIETFQGDWEQEWFTYNLDQWPRTTHKLFDDQYKAPQDARLVLDVQSDESNQLVVLIDDYVAEVSLEGGDSWQEIVLSCESFRNFADESLPGWGGAKRLTLSATERLRPGRGQQGEARVFGKAWQGESPRFRNLRWHVGPVEID
ncbi:MAG: dienelactone hydrolase family protein [Rubripirellula sp.]